MLLVEVPASGNFGRLLTQGRRGCKPRQEDQAKTRDARYTSRHVRILDLSSRPPRREFYVDARRGLTRTAKVRDSGGPPDPGIEIEVPGSKFH